MMVAEWSYNVPKGKSEEFDRFLRERTRPLWKARAASHQAYRCIAKRYFDYQTSDDATRIVEQIRFKTVGDFEKFLQDYASGAEDYRVLQDYEGRLETTNPSFRIYEELR